MLFAVHTNNIAQNVTRKKEQVSAMMSRHSIKSQAAINNRNTSRYIYFNEGFDNDFLPLDWNQEVVNENNTWSQLNPESSNFNEIDSTSKFSAMIPWAIEYQDEWIISPEIVPTEEYPLSINFYAGVSGPWLPNATLKCLISTNGGNTWVEIWNAINEIDPSASWGWNLVSIDLSDYTHQAFKIAWQYIGTDGDLAGIDGVCVEAGFSYLIFDDMETYTIGAKLASQANPDWWTTWSDDPGGNEDGLVTNETSFSPTQACMISDSNDQLLKLGDKTSGAYIFSVMYYIPLGYGGYINMQHFESPGFEWAWEIYLGADENDLNGYIFAGSTTPFYFSFPHDRWIKLETMINLDTDKAIFKIDGSTVTEWQFSLQSNGYPGTKQIGSVNFYAEAPWGDIPKYYFDDPAFMVYNQGLSNPAVNIDTSSINIALQTNESVIMNRNMSNQGESDLIYEIIPTYNSNTNIFQNETEYSPTGIKVTNLNPIKQDYYSTTPNLTDQDVILHYDGDYFTAIGSPVEYEYYVSSMFPHEMIRPYIGMIISSVEVYINDPVNEAKIQIYDMGTLYSTGPGELLLEQDFSAVAYGWNVVELITPITITGRDIWVGWSMSAPGNHYAPGCDAGPANENGDWISNGTGWSHLSTNPEMNYNWNIRANLSGSPAIQWLSTTPFAGMLSHNEELEIGINIDATGLVSNVYEATLILRTNDRENNMVAINVILTITNGISASGELEYFSVYPNPVSKILHVDSNAQITKMQLINAAGQVVFDNTVSEINVSYFDKGVYILQLNTKNGSSTQKILIQ